MINSLGLFIHLRRLGLQLVHHLQLPLEALLQLADHLDEAHHARPRVQIKHCENKFSGTRTISLTQGKSSEVRVQDQVPEAVPVRLDEQDCQQQGAHQRQDVQQVKEHEGVHEHGLALQKSVDRTHPTRFVRYLEAAEEQEDARAYQAHEERRRRDDHRFGVVRDLFVDVSLQVGGVHPPGQRLREGLRRVRLHQTEPQEHTRLNLLILSKNRSLVCDIHQSEHPYYDGAEPQRARKAELCHESHQTLCGNTNKPTD
jgi:hypothetical protein